MLKIKQKHSLTLPHIYLSHREMQFATAPLDNDEISDEIREMHESDDYNWRLDERPDSEQLAAYWNQVEEDVRNDPEWFTFAD